MQDFRSAFTPVPQYTLPQLGYYQQPIYYPMVAPTFVPRLPITKRVKIVIQKQRASSDEGSFSDCSTGDESLKETKLRKACLKNKNSKVIQRNAKSTSSEPERKKRKYTRSWLKDFVSDTKPVDMSVMDEESMTLIRAEDYNTLVDSITYKLKQGGCSLE